MSEDLNKLRELAEAATPGPWNYEGLAHLGEKHETITSSAEIILSEVGHPSSENAAFIAAFNPATALSLLSRLQAAEERAEKAEEDLAVIHRAAAHCCGRFGGRMSEVDRIFQEITRVSSMHETRAALKTGA